MNFITLTPEPNSKLCRYVQYGLALILSYANYLVTALFFFIYNWYYAFFALVLSYVISGIIRAKIRNASVPTTQQEFNYSDKEIVAWFLYRNYPECMREA